MKQTQFLNAATGQIREFRIKTSIFRFQNTSSLRTNITVTKVTYSIKKAGLAEIN